MSATLFEVAAVKYTIPKGCNMDPAVFVYYETADTVAAQAAAFLVEGGKPVALQQGWTYRADRPHVPATQPHVHIMLKKNEVSVINRNGTQSHGTTRDNVPNWVLQKIRDTGLIESTLIVEAGVKSPVLVPPFTIGTAITHALLAAP